MEQWVRWAKWIPISVISMFLVLLGWHLLVTQADGRLFLATQRPSRDLWFQYDPGSTTCQEDSVCTDVFVTATRKHCKAKQLLGPERECSACANYLTGQRQKGYSWIEMALMSRADFVNWFDELGVGKQKNEPLEILPSACNASCSLIVFRGNVNKWDEWYIDSTGAKVPLPIPHGSATAFCLILMDVRRSTASVIDSVSFNPDSADRHLGWADMSTDARHVYYSKNDLQTLRYDIAEQRKDTLPYAGAPFVPYGTNDVMIYSSDETLLTLLDSTLNIKAQLQVEIGHKPYSAFKMSDGIYLVCGSSRLSWEWYAATSTYLVDFGRATARRISRKGFSWNILAAGWDDETPPPATVDD